MQKPKYTQGNWRPTAFAIYVGTTRILAFPVHNGISISENQANLELCAAAPEMYEALKGILLVAQPTNKTVKFEFEKTYQGKFEVLGNRLEKALEAIEKVEGKNANTH